MMNRQAKIENIIALCHIIDDFEEFKKRLLSVISPKYNRGFVYDLLDVSKGNFKLGLRRKAKKFYSENKAIIDTINKYSDISEFICDNYGWHGELTGNLEFFYEYILEHKKDIEQILAVLEKLKELGFKKFEFNKDYDFTKEIYYVNPSFTRNYTITYVANAQVTPSYEDYINYKTIDSNYRMRLSIIGEEISEYGKEMKLNSLLFDPKSLPESIDRENTFEYLLRLKNEQKEQSDIIRNSVDLSISISDLENQLNSTNATINRLDIVKTKDEILSILLSIEENVEKLKTLSAEYDSSVSEQEPSLTPEVLEKERYLYLKRRYWDNIDID